MNDELKRYLDGIEARIMVAIDRLRGELTAEIEMHAGEKRIDAVARKLDGLDGFGS